MKNEQWEGMIYDKAADRFVVDISSCSGEMHHFELARGFDWRTIPDPFDNDVYNFLYIAREGGENGDPYYELACELYSAFRTYRTIRDTIEDTDIQLSDLQYMLFRRADSNKGTDLNKRPDLRWSWYVVIDGDDHAIDRGFAISGETILNKFPYLAVQPITQNVIDNNQWGFEITNEQYRTNQQTERQ